MIYSLLMSIFFVSLVNGFRGAGVQILHGNRVLLVQNLISGNWGFPKGHRESEDRTWMQTAIREVREETGYQEGIDYSLCSKEPELWGRRPYWTGTLLRYSPIRINRSEHRDGQWILIDDLHRYPLNRDLTDWYLSGSPIKCYAITIKIDT